MIPPLQPSRLRSINRWMQDNRPQHFQELTRSAELNSRVQEMDDQMIQAFETSEDAKKDQMMRSKTWGTEQGMQEFQTARLTLWEQIVEEFLPVTSDPQLEG